MGGDFLWKLHVLKMLYAALNIIGWEQKSKLGQNSFRLFEALLLSTSRASNVTVEKSEVF